MLAWHFQPTTTQQYNKSITYIYAYLFNYVNLNPLQTYSVCVVVSFILYFTIPLPRVIIYSSIIDGGLCVAKT